MSTETVMKDWIPLLSSLVTPLFIILLIVWFRSDVVDFIQIAKKAVGEQGRSLETPWLKIGERARETEISKLNLGDLSVSLVDHDYEEWVIEKGDESLIDNLRQQSEEHGGKPVDVMILKTGIRYSSVVLEKYVNMLGVKYIIFMGDGEFESWIPAGLFMGQLRSRTIYTYTELKNEILGLRDEYAFPSSSASEVLMQMQNKQTDHIAIVTEDMRYLYMVSKQDIL
ncbi:MAG: hypothetical protein KJO03_06470, partial [Gammaproteobacteria bacterium]|nr:hypothetical protein [Gammaproteobacteria bacterium]